MNERRRLRVGQAITPEEFDELDDDQLARLVPKAYREYFPGKDACGDGFLRQACPLPRDRRQSRLPQRPVPTWEQGHRQRTSTPTRNVRPGAGS